MMAKNSNYAQSYRNTAKLKRRLSKNMRRSLGTWNYRYWLMRVEAACEIGRSSFRSVAPQYTSQRCHVWSHREGES